jgi:hypothetical protein
LTCAIIVSRATAAVKTRRQRSHDGTLACPHAALAAARSATTSTTNGPSTTTPFAVNQFWHPYQGSDIGDITQTRGTIGLFYTYLGHDTFSAVEWR